VEIEPSSRNYLTFTAPITCELFRYVRCPFGLSSAPMAMCLIINNVFRGQLRHKVYTYLDDILSSERKFQDHLQNLTNIFHQLRVNRLRCNPAKCEFAQSELVFLGCTISAEGIGIADSKLDIIRKIQPPKSVKSVQRLLTIQII